MVKILSLFAVVASFATLSSAAAEEKMPRISGQIDIGGRYFNHDGLYAGQTGQGSYAYIGGRLETSFDLGSGQVAVEVAGTYDERNGRTYGTIQKLYYAHSVGNWDFLYGFNTENWGVAESLNIVNVINPSDQSDPITGKGLIGTPMINANFHSSMGTFSGYILAPFLEGNHLKSSSRFRGPVLPDFDNPVFEEGDGRHVDFALRHVNNVDLGMGTFDYSISYFNGTNRNPGCTNIMTGGGASSCNDAILSGVGPGAPAPGASNSAFWNWMNANATDATVAGVSAMDFPGLKAYFQKMEQVSATGVYAYDDLQLRFEGFYRWTSAGNFFASIIGGDYTFNNIAGSENSLTVAVEYLFDDRQAGLGTAIFDNDVFLGLDYRLNNAYDTRANFGVFHDLESHANLFKLGFYSRVNDNLGVTLNATKVVTTGWNDPLAFIKYDDFVELQLNVFF